MNTNRLSAGQLDEAVRTLSRPFKINQAFARPPPGDIPTTVFQTLASSAPVLRPGLLGRLPLELMVDVCMSLDIASVFSLSHSSRYAREAIASIKKFRLVGKHAAGCIWLYLNTQVASHVQLRALYSALTTRTCSFCLRNGELLSIPTVQRCCLKCFAQDSRLLPLFLIELTRGVPGCPSAKVVKRDFPVLRTIPNSYGWSQVPIGRRRYVVAGQHARQLQQGWGRFLPRSKHRRSLVFATFTMLPYLNRETQEIQGSFSCRACMAGVCNTREEFIAHLQRCAEAAEHWLWMKRTRSR